MFSFFGIIYYIFLDSSMVEHSAVNRVVVGSSPTRGVIARDDEQQSLTWLITKAMWVQFPLPLLSTCYQ